MLIIGNTNREGTIVFPATGFMLPQQVLGKSGYRKKKKRNEYGYAFFHTRKIQDSRKYDQLLGQGSTLILGKVAVITTFYKLEITFLGLTSYFFTSVTSALKFFILRFYRERIEF